ncbi:hypothetical protein [Endomicrobium proavitum]|uniref:Uncharacterized protein n=1 Tax=Endomicrobium proavitum TaxID=1408281 RepID=A0A0G3WI03_9BACT|nr:hypothetical protein [Endomicrobium proavitum]AKL97505.1 membrane protein of unknown function [Endomicrobium proavitum]
MPAQTGSSYASFILGVILIIANYPLGWVGLVWLSHFASKTGKKIYYFYAAFVYAVSWALLFAGIYLCGKEYAAALFREYHTYIIAGTVIFITAIVALNLFFYKKGLKNQSKHSIDKKA